MATKPDREVELSQTNRGVGGVCVGVVRRVQSKLSRALPAHRGKKLLQDLQTQESAATIKEMARLRGAREKGAMAFVECLGFSQEDMMEGPLWRETLGRSNSSRRRAGNGGDTGGKRKKCRKERVGSVAANQDNLERYMEAGRGQQGAQGSSKICTSRESVSPLSRLIRGFRNKYH